MALFYVTRPSDEPAGWDSQRRQPFYQYTRYGAMQRKRDRAIKQAQRVKGRAYEYDGEHRLVFDADSPDNVNAERMKAPTHEGPVPLLRALAAL